MKRRGQQRGMKRRFVPSTHTSPNLQLRQAPYTTGPPAYIGAYDRQEAHTYDPVLSFTCPSTPAKTRQGACTYDPTFFLYLPAAYPCKNWGSRQGAYTHDHIISYPVLLYLPEYACKNQGFWQGVYTYEPILNVPDKIAIVPSTHTSLNLRCGEQPYTTGRPAYI